MQCSVKTQRKYLVLWAKSLMKWHQIIACFFLVSILIDYNIYLWDFQLTVEQAFHAYANITFKHTILNHRNISISYNSLGERSASFKSPLAFWRWEPRKPCEIPANIKCLCCSIRAIQIGKIQCRVPGETIKGGELKTVFENLTLQS